VKEDVLVRRKATERKGNAQGKERKGKEKEENHEDRSFLLAAHPTHRQADPGDERPHHMDRNEAAELGVPLWREQAGRGRNQQNIQTKDDERKSSWLSR
jgi:hypothetical protein